MNIANPATPHSTTSPQHLNVQINECLVSSFFLYVGNSGDVKNYWSAQVTYVGYKEYAELRYVDSVIHVFK